MTASNRSARRYRAESPNRTPGAPLRLVGAGLTGLSLIGVGLVATSAPAAAATTNPAPAAGNRASATRLPFTVSGTANLSVDVGTGNALLSDQLLTLPGVTGDVPVALTYNSTLFGSTVPSAVTGDAGSGWSITGFDQRIVANSDGSATYYGPQDLTGVFTAGSTSETYVTPTQFRATLTGSSSKGWALSDHGSGAQLAFTTAGRLSTVKDRNGNTTTFSYTSSGLPASIVTSRGAAAAHTLTVGLSGSKITSLTQTSGSLTRKVTLGYSSNGHLASVTDTAGGVTKFASAYSTDTGQLVSVTNPAGSATSLTYSGAKVAQVNQANTATGSPGASYTRISYASATQTLVADPTTSQSSAVSAVPHTTYTLTSAQLVSAATDPDGHQRSATYTSLGNIASTTPAAGGATTYSYGANSGESLTSVASPGGATSTASYSNTGASQYLPSSATNDSGNATKYSYNGTGNQLTTAQGTGPSATVTYNTDGTAATSASPGAASGVSTKYAYDSTHNLTSITPPSGTSLGARSYTWDGYGRLATATDGRGNTTTYTYDAADRITKIAYSDTATQAVTYAYDSLGRVTSRADGNGTTTYTWDSLGRLLSTSNSAGGGTISYRYDTAGALASQTDARGTTTYSYDAAHELTGMAYPKGSGTATIAFANDASGRRTDTWLASNSDHSTWAAHTQLTYDPSGRVTHVQAQTDSSKPYSVEDQTYCYAAGSTAPTCSTTPSADRSKIQWISDVKTGETTAYIYDGLGRLTKVTVTGGSNPRTYSYSYDSAGNRLTAATTGSSASNQSLTFNAGNQISTTGYTYDGAGNLTKLPSGIKLGYNSSGQRITATNTSGTPTDTYTYGGTGQAELLSQTAAGGDTYKYAYGRTDDSGVPEIEEVSLTSGGSTYQAYVAHDPSGQPVALQTSTGAVALYVYDGRHNPEALVTDYPSVAYVLQFDPYGTASASENSGGTGYPQNPYVFAGGLQDRDTGLIRYGARWYNPATGTWLEQDGFNAPLDPANANRYAYVGDDPINGIDPTGRDVDVTYHSCFLFICDTLGQSVSNDGETSSHFGIEFDSGEGGYDSFFTATYTP